MTHATPSLGTISLPEATFLKLPDTVSLAGREAHIPEHLWQERPRSRPAGCRTARAPLGRVTGGRAPVLGFQVINSVHKSVGERRPLPQPSVSLGLGHSTLPLAPSSLVGTYKYSPL